MKYEIRKSYAFDAWLRHLKDRRAVMLIAKRIVRAINGNFGDVRSLGGGLYEMRLFVGKGYRLYYTVRYNQVVFLLYGGHKGQQSEDIKKAKRLLKELGESHDFKNN
ncbi:type II toxin-antitoxin system RelE/ParE family toxin [Idiomarina zobellii]|jgi:putative addiction module killer protein|uniref:Addiction module killer protein n=1 Tax=Idiomarina zobellii TaxID=86103 RepID=A0A837NEP2_9GAMM|nr:type II toxin-antitoxin system RelE/ParE family toxin [Idiomarina zobellii]KPD23636.1 hypothetical protein AFK76_08190 [Idiomarina zobellii]